MIAFAVVLLLPGVTLFLIGLAYVSSGPVEWVWRWRTGRVLVPLPEDATLSETTEGVSHE